MYIKCTCTDGKSFTEGQKYYILDYIAGGGYMVADNDGKSHYISGNYFTEHFEKELYATMSTVIKQHKENGIYVVMEWEKSNTYRVASYICHHDGRSGYPIKEMTYSNNEKKKAEATFRRYVKKYCKGE